MLTPVAIGLILLWGDKISFSATDSSALMLSGLFAAAVYLCKSWLIDFSYENLKETTSSDWNRRKKLFIDSFLISITAAGSIACIWIGFGSEGAAQFNGALTALAPIGLATLVAQLSLQKSLAQSHGRIKSQDILLVTLLLGASIVWTFAISSLSPSIGLLILGENWVNSQKVLIALGTLLIVNLLIEALAIFARSLGFFDAIIDSGEAIFQTAGALGNGERVFLLAKLPEDFEIAGEKIEKYILLSNSHDGSSSVIAGLTNIRVVCNNTLQAALGNLENKVRIDHVGGAKNKLRKHQGLWVLQVNIQHKLREYLHLWLSIK
jgi:hypothetical protein